MNADIRMPLRAVAPWHADFRISRQVEQRFAVLKHTTKNLWLVSDQHAKALHGPLGTPEEVQACLAGSCRCSNDQRVQLAARRALAASQEAKHAAQGPRNRSPIALPVAASLAA